MDFAYDDVPLVVEALGHTHHASELQLIRDAQRRNALQLEGFTVLEFLSDDVIRHRPPSSARSFEAWARLAERGAPPDDRRLVAPTGPGRLTWRQSLGVLRSIAALVARRGERGLRVCGAPCARSPRWWCAGVERTVASTEPGTGGDRCADLGVVGRAWASLSAGCASRSHGGGLCLTWRQGGVAGTLGNLP
ncbi:MAG: DUF559 domain-containing protein [Acidimicrobiales bacterium]